MSVFKQKASSGNGDGSDFETCPAGTHAAVLIGLFDLGTHEEDYQGKKNKKRKVFLVWELTDERKEDGKTNFTIGKQMTLSLNKKAALRAFIEKWRGKSFGEGEDFDITQLVGKKCALSVGHTQSGERSYANVDGAAIPHKSMTIPAPQNQTVTWSVEGTDPVPALPWIPFIYGEPLKVVAERCEEMHGKMSAPANGNGSHAAREPVGAGAAADEAPF